MYAPPIVWTILSKRELILNEKREIFSSLIRRRKKMDRYENWYKKHETEILKNYFTLLRFPSVSAQRRHEKDVLACASWVEKQMQRIGMKTERLEGKGYPSTATMMFSRQNLSSSGPLNLSNLRLEMVGSMQEVQRTIRGSGGTPSMR